MKRITVCIVVLLMCANQAMGYNTNVAYLRAAFQSSAADYDHTAHMAFDGMEQTCWQCSSNDVNPWIYVDLGGVCSIDGIQIDWGTQAPKEFSIEVADKGNANAPEQWRKLHTATAQSDKNAIRFKYTNARFVKLTIKGQGNHIIKEIRVTGRQAAPRNTVVRDHRKEQNKLFLEGSSWTLKRAEQVESNGEQIASTGFDDHSWIPAKVPGTVLVSYLEYGALPDPNYADNQLMISESFFTADFWYRCQFATPENYDENQSVWLNFDGINWKADIYLNGQKAGEINGAYTRKRIDVTKLLNKQTVNSLAILVHTNDNPGEPTEQHLFDPDPNGGIIGKDSPTILASIGWNWMPTIRGRNCGIVDDVYLSASGKVTIDDPYVKTELTESDNSEAKLTLGTDLTNHSSETINGELKVNYKGQYAVIHVTIEPNSTKTISFSPAMFTIKSPELWWPNGYGEQNLQSMQLSFEVDQHQSDSRQLTFGIRQYSYVIENSNLQICVNGTPVILRGGNWGLAESMMRYRKEQYDLAVKLHKLMNFNIIRNWIGMCGDEEFYQACDRNGIMIWDDFWLANPVDGPVPSNEEMFMANAKDKIKHFRNHPSIVLWCGRNEGYPPSSLDTAMRQLTEEEDATRYYIPHSAATPVSGLGPYQTKDPAWYFTNRGFKIHSEQGIVAPPSVESFKAMMSEKDLWPISDMWGKHDWTQERVQIFTEQLTRNYGAPQGIEDFTHKAQMINMEGSKAMMESVQSNRRGGMLVWMTHPAWPSLICQSYDYYFEPTAAYFGFKSGSEPIHIMWRADNNAVEVINNTIEPLDNLSARIRLYDLKGNTLYDQTVATSVGSNTKRVLQTLACPQNASEVYFIELKLFDGEGKTLSNNFYWNGREYGNYTALNQMEQAEVEVEAQQTIETGEKCIKVTVDNKNKVVALMLRLILIDQTTGERILPAIYQENYFSLVPDQKTSCTITFDSKLLNSRSKPMLAIEGWNLKRQNIKIINQ